MQAFFTSVFRVLVQYRAAILLLAFVASGAYFLQGYLSFDSLREHWAVLIEFRMPITWLRFWSSFWSIRCLWRFPCREV